VARLRWRPIGCRVSDKDYTDARQAGPTPIPMTDKNGRPIIIIKKKVIAHGGHHGGAWKVAYADFVTAMMSLFIVLWLMNSNAKVKEAVAGYFKDPSGVGKLSGTNKEGRDKTIVVQIPGPAGKNVPVPVAAKQPPPPDVTKPVPVPVEKEVPAPEFKKDMEKLKEQLEKALKNLPAFPKMKDHIAITVSSEGVRMELMETAKGLFFENGSPTPTKEGQTVLRTVSSLVNKMPNRVMIEGHTDSVPFVGTTGYSNWELSSDRANAARIIMENTGLRKGQLFQIRGFADQQLRLPNKPDDPSNRRISIIVLNLPTLPEPKQAVKPNTKSVSR
jgi:chemotaxis protein MotB